MTDLDDVLQHYGVKGMKWGVRRDRGSSRSNIPTVKEIVKSSARELSWVGKARIDKLNKMSTREIKSQTNRLRLENDLKRLSSNIFLGTMKDRKDYRGRSKMSDDELRRKVDRLRAKEEFKKQAKQATKSQLNMGKKIVSTAAPIAIGILATQYPGIKDKVKELNTKQNREAAANALKFILK